MQTGIYDSIPVRLSQGERQQEYVLRYNESTQSVRVEGSRLRRSIFIGHRTFNRLLQFYRNEYGCTLGKIQYENRDLQKGFAITSDNKRYRFKMNLSSELSIEMEEDVKSGSKITAVVASSLLPSKRKYLTALIPSILTAILYAGETSLAA